MKSRLFSIVLIVCVCLAAAGSGRGQVRPVYDRGAVGLLQLLKRLNTTASALMIGAHPDDEDTALLAYLARGENARTAYLSLTRGDGGQNIIGPELGESLGVIRTEELLQARRLDGAEQFFTRAYDYGFSKTLDEAKEKWDEKVILCDVVRVIRSFRPLVVISQFSGTPADGHGQHQFAGYITPLAVKAAEDRSQCSDAGPVWTVRKLYVRHRGQGEPTLRINTGKYDPILGRSYFEIAMEARSQHKSQEQGVLELRGDQFSSLNLVGSRQKETGIFDGLDISLSETYGSAIREFDANNPDNLLPVLIRGYTASAASGAAAKKEQLVHAITSVAGIEVDALSDSETVVPGESFFVAVKTYSPLKRGVTVKEIRLVAPDQWTVSSAETPKTNTAAFVSREVAAASAFFNVAVPRDWRATQPYWLAEPRDGDMFRLPGDSSIRILPVGPPLVYAAVTLEVLGTLISVSRPVEFRFADDIRGEIRRNINVVPNVTVEMDQPLMIASYSTKPQVKTVVMTVTNHSRKPVTGVASLNINAPTEWKYTASSKAFDIKRTGEKAAILFEVTIPPRTPAGNYQIAGNAMVGEAMATSTMHTIAYPHIQTHRFYRRAETKVTVIDLKTAPVKVGYIAGSGDRVPEAIRQMGFDLGMISERELATGRLSRFDAIVVGIRAYQVRPDVVANNERLLNYVREGGTLIVQYQLPGYAQAGLTPFPTQMGPRVSDENAPIRILTPDHPMLNFPNKIAEADFSGWVQERNLYNFTNFAPEYTGILESHDRGEAQNSGGLVVAKLGKGNYVYCSYSLFRQLPAGVSGAYRLLANLLSQPKAPTERK